MINMKASELRGKTIAFAGSGGLDSCTITRWLADQGVSVVCCTVDMAQPDEDDMDAIEKRMRKAGVSDYVLIPARQEIAQAGLDVIQNQALYEGRYWNTTGIARYVIVQAVLKEMQKRNLEIFSHGATGRGNDQVRFQLGMNMLAPNVEIYAPWRDPEFLARFKGRGEMIDFCESRGLEIKATRSKPYSTDANMLGLTHEAGILESLTTGVNAITSGMGVLPKDAPESGTNISIRFEQGVPVALDGKRLSLFEIFEQANKQAGKHGVGIGVHLVENRFVGIKSRGVYEAPAMELLGSAYEYLLQLVLDRRAREFFDYSAKFLGKQIYTGYWFDQGTEIARSALASVSKIATGTITVSMRKGLVMFEAAEDVPHSLYLEDEASMEAVGTYDHADAEGFLRILGVGARAVALTKGS
jgi:argininosuccinate synthase